MRGFNAIPLQVVCISETDTKQVGSSFNNKHVEYLIKSNTEVPDQQSEPTLSSVRRPPQDTPQGYCSLYTGSVCRKYLPSQGLVYYNFSTDGSATPINEQITQGLWKEVISSLLEPCRTAAETLLCHYAFPA
ncbi:hypothetical protein AVEN_227604-1, partial [Araneus ventricosus]